MERITLEMTPETSLIWQSLSPEQRQKLSSRAVNALLNGELYPTGTDKLELAIELAEAGLPVDIISKLTHLLPEVFESFLKK